MTYGRVVENSDEAVGGLQGSNVGTIHSQGPLLGRYEIGNHNRLDGLYLLVNSWGIVQGSNNDLSKKCWEIGSGDTYYGHTGVPSARVGTSLSI